MTLSLLKLFGFLLLFGAVYLFTRQLLPDQKEQELRQRTGLNQEREWSEEATLVKWFYPAIRLLAPLIKLLPVPNYKLRLKRWIISAGIEGAISTDELIGLQFVLAAFFPVLIHQVFDGIVPMIFAVVIGGLFPFVWVYEKRKKRHQLILQNMPTVIDTLALSVEAGMDFNSAAMRICEQHKNTKDQPLIDEFRHYQRNIRLGLTREEALTEMANRIDLQDIYAFTSILIQAEKMGASIGSVLKDQGNNQRRERFMNAEKAGAEATSKLLIPMVVFIFPLVFVVVLGPYILKFIYGK